MFILFFLLLMANALKEIIFIFLHYLYFGRIEQRTLIHLRICRFRINVTVKKNECSMKLNRCRHSYNVKVKFYVGMARYYCVSQCVYMCVYWYLFVCLLSTLFLYWLCCCSCCYYWQHFLHLQNLISISAFLLTL